MPWQTKNSWQKENSMDLAHESALNDLIRDVLDTGVGRVEKRLLLRWFGARNWTKKIWTGLNQRFIQELTERKEQDDEWELRAIDNGDFVSLLCFSPKDEKWWQPVALLARGL
jgi:hypothetical protein